MHMTENVVDVQVQMHSINLMCRIDPVGDLESQVEYHLFGECGVLTRLQLSMQIAVFEVLSE